MRAYIQCEKDRTIPFWLKEFIIETVDDIESADLFILKGFRNVHPSLYEDQHEHPFLPKTYDKSLDASELTLLKKAIRMEIPIVAIQRGAVLAGILAGCGIIQFGSARSSILEMKTIKGSFPYYNIMPEILDPSWIFPKHKYSLIGYTDSSEKMEKGNRLSYFNSKKEATTFRVPSVIYFKDISCLAISSDMPAIADSGRTYIQFLKNSFKEMMKIAKTYEVYE